MNTHGHQSKTTELVLVKCTASSLNEEAHLEKMWYILYVPCCMLAKDKNTKLLNRTLVTNVVYPAWVALFLLPPTPRPNSVYSSGFANLCKLNNASIQLFSYLLWARNYEQPNVRKYIYWLTSCLNAALPSSLPLLNTSFREAIYETSRNRETHRVFSPAGLLKPKNTNMNSANWQAWTTLHYVV